jgi:exopolyphosphatase/guanosine-5'-triphosphate,3'-diphosphate pyrophosphatase
MSVLPLPEPRAERLGAIDVGSNSIRLLVADWDPRSGGIAVVDEVKAQPRLAQGLAATGRLDEAAMERALEALERMDEVARRRGVRRLGAVATAAVREAQNGEAFVRRVQTRLGIPLQIIDEETEARLSYRSVAHHFRLEDRRTLVVDIGGGSLEVIGAVRGVLELTLSLPLGAVRLTELHLPGNRRPLKEVRALRLRIRKKLRKAAAWRAWTGAAVFGSGGSFTNLGRMAAARRGAPIGAVHGIAVTTAEVEHLLEWLGSMTAEERRQVPGLNPQRADIILAGLAVTSELLEQVDAAGLVVSAFGLREGLLLEMIGLETPPSGDPVVLAREFAIRCQCDAQHIEQVRRLALELFDRLAEPLAAGPEERGLLEVAAVLHDVGQLVSYRKRHEHSYELIMHAEHLRLSARERQLVALAARYHRQEVPSKKDPEFAALGKPERGIVRRLAAILRVADGLDRGYTSVVQSVRTRLTDRRLRITPVARARGADLSLECWGAQRRTGILADLLGREVVVVAGRS